MPINLKKHILITLSINYICFLAFSVLVTESSAQTNPAANEILEGTKTTVFEYQLEGRPDPFEPFIKPQVATTAPDEVIDEKKELKGMQLFEPGQLKLVGVLFAGDTKMAMVEDVTGKGHIIDEGILIGKYGVVSEITQDKVLITEKKQMRSGKEITSTVVMRLSRAGD